MISETQGLISSEQQSNPRMTSRVSVKVSGRLHDEMPFEEECYTVATYGHGGILELRAAVTKGQRLNLLNNGTGERAMCRVAHAAWAGNGLTLVRLQFVSGNARFWTASSAGQLPPAPAKV
jgi:hypothetical protein